MKQVWCELEEGCTHGILEVLEQAGVKVKRFSDRLFKVERKSDENRSSLIWAPFGFLWLRPEDLTWYVTPDMPTEATWDFGIKVGRANIGVEVMEVLDLVAC